MRLVYFFFILFLAGCGSNDVNLQDKENLENELISRIKAKENEVQKSFEAKKKTRISRKKYNDKKNKISKLKLEKRKRDSKVIVHDTSQGDVGGDRKKGDSIALEPANKHYKTQIYGPDRVTIQGKMCALIRKYF